MIISKYKFDPETLHLDAFKGDVPASLRVLNGFFRGLGWNVAVSRHDQCDGGQLYFHERDDVNPRVEVTYPVDAGTFYQQTVECIFDAHDMTLDQWMAEALKRQDTWGTGRCYR